MIHFRLHTVPECHYRISTTSSVHRKQVSGRCTAVLLCAAILLFSGRVASAQPAPAATDTTAAIAEPDTGTSRAETPVLDTTSNAAVSDSTTADATVTSPTAMNDTTAAAEDSTHSTSALPGSPATVSEKPEASGLQPTEDSTGLRDGLHFSAGIGWMFGGYELLSLWENAQPDSLQHLGLTDSSYRVPFDSTLQNSDVTDSALLEFKVKEAPVAYTMSFPVIMSLISLRQERKLSLSLSGSWMRKVFTGTISARGDTLGRNVDFKESVNVYTMLLSLQWGRPIPTRYFSIEGVDRSYFTAGFDLAPMVGVRVRRTATATADFPRFTTIADQISSPPKRFLHGGAAGIRLGISMLRRLNAASATDFGIWYTIRGYGYFLENGDRVGFTDIDPASKKEGRPLFWISNRLELSFAFMRHVKR
jgi:hypothetical protein